MISDIATGSSAPLGATAQPGGVNFSVYSKSASSVELLLFENENNIKPARVVRLDAQKNRTYHYWHVLVPDLEPGQLYGFRAFGEFKPEQGCASTVARSCSILTVSRLRFRRHIRAFTATRLR